MAAMKPHTTAPDAPLNGTAYTGSWNPDSSRELPFLKCLQNQTLAAQAKIPVAIVESERAVREALQLLLGQAPEIRCTAAFANTESALKGIPRHRPEVLLIGLTLQTYSAVECVRFLKRQLIDMRVLMLTNGEDVEQVFEALRAGANGFVFKGNLATDVLPAICEAAAGGAPMSKGVVAQFVAFFQKQGETSSLFNELSPRETQILDCLASSFLYKEIADKLDITYDTVNGYVKSLYQKLHVHSRAQAVAKCLNGWPHSGSCHISRPASPEFTQRP